MSKNLHMQNKNVKFFPLKLVHNITIYVCDILFYLPVVYISIDGVLMCQNINKKTKFSKMLTFLKQNSFRYF